MLVYAGHTIMIKLESRNNEIKKSDLAVLVVSCDKYSDMWGPFFQLFWRFWPDCTFKVYLLCNNLRIYLPKVNMLLIGDDISWSDNLKKALQLIREEYVLLFIDDLFLLSPVQAERLEKVFSWIIVNRPNCVRMNCYADNYPVPNKPDKPYNDFLGIVSKGMDYRVSTVLTVWKREYLMNLLGEGENAWEFEICGTERANFSDGYYSTYENHFHVVNCVIRGKWRPSAICKLNDIGIKINKEGRLCMTTIETLKLFIKERISYLLSILPAGLKRRIRKAIMNRKA